MGAVDLVIQVERRRASPAGSSAIGRAGHQVGEPIKGVIFPKYRGDLVETAVVTRRMHEGAIEATGIPRNPLDVLAQQIVATTVDGPRTVDELTPSRASRELRELGARRSKASWACWRATTRRDEFAELGHGSSGTGWPAP